MFLWLAPARAADTPSVEAQVKAAFLGKFPSYVEWPGSAFPTPQAPIVIGVLGPDPFGPQFDEAAKQLSHGGRSVAVRRFASLRELEGCHILFITDPEHRNLVEILARLRGTPVLTVGDAERFAHQGGMVNFIKVDGKVRFEINLEAARKAGLKLSSKIIQVSQVVNALEL